MTSDDDFQTATGAQLAARLYHAALACDGHPDIGRPLARLVSQWERRCTWRLALVSAADVLCPDWRTLPYKSGAELSAMLSRLDGAAARRIALGHRKPSATEALLMPLLYGPRSPRAIGGELSSIASAPAMKR